MANSGCCVCVTVPKPGQQSIWRQCPPSARKQSTNKLPNRPGFTHVHPPPLQHAYRQEIINFTNLDGRLVDVSIFFFFCSGEGKGEREAPGGGGAIFHGNSQGGGGSRVGGGGGARSREVVCGEGGGLNIFFPGPKCPPRAKSRDPNRESLATLRFEIAIRNARVAIRFKHSDTAKLRKGLRFESAIQNR